MQQQNNNGIEKKCSVCNNLYKIDKFDLYPCPICGWYNDFMCEENPDDVIYRNLISFNKAKRLYKEGKPFQPNLDEFIEALFYYSEVQFEYNGTYYGVVLTGTNDNNTIIKMFQFDNKSSYTFKTKEEFKNTAKIGNQYLKDIWDKTTDRYWLQ